jgi:hypothetical protein
MIRPTAGMLRLSFVSLPGNRVLLCDPSERDDICTLLHTLYIHVKTYIFMADYQSIM